MSDECDEFLKGLGRNLGGHMEALGVSAGLAEAAGLPEGRIERIVAGEVDADAIELMHLARGLGVFPGELLEGLDPVLAEAEYELPILKVYSGGRRAGGRPFEDPILELLGSRLSRSDRTVMPSGRELWTAMLRKRRRLLIDTGYIGFDPRRGIYDLTDRGEARLRELELSQGEDTDAAAGRSRPAGGDGDRHDGRSEHRWVSSRQEM